DGPRPGRGARGGGAIDRGGRRPPLRLNMRGRLRMRQSTPMATIERHETRAIALSDFLPVLRDAGILPSGHFDEVRRKVHDGTYPREPLPLARRLVSDKLLAPYQARCILHNKPEYLQFGPY